MEYLVQLITVGGPVVVLVGVYIRLYVGKEVAEVQRQILTEVTTCADKLHDKANGKLETAEFNRVIARLQDAFDEMQATFIDVLRNIDNHNSK